MEDASDQTIQTYRRNFDKYVQKTPAQVGEEFQHWMDDFLSRIPSGGSILELGSAFGRDARYFAEKGYRVTCTDVIPQALEMLSSAGFETAEYDFRTPPKPEWTGRFDGFFANAVLLHAQPSTFESAVSNVAVVLKDGGAAAISLKSGQGEEVTLEKMDSPRYFRYYTEDAVREVIERLPFETVSVAQADGGKWLHFILRRFKR